MYKYKPYFKHKDFIYNYYTIDAQPFTIIYQIVRGNEL